MWQMTDDWQCDKTASDMGVRMKQRCVIKFLHAVKIAPSNIRQRLLNVYRDQTVDVSTVWWVARFSSSDSDVKDKPHSGRPHTAVTTRNEEHLNQLTCAIWRITTRELCMELNIGFNALGTMVATLEYRKVCIRWVPRMLTRENKEHQMQVCWDILNQYEAEGDSFLDRIITSDETWCHHYEPGSKQQSMEWVTYEFPIEEKVQDAASKVMCTVFWDRKGVILLDILELGQTINSDRHITTMTKLKAKFPESGQRRRQPFSCNTIMPGPIPHFPSYDTVI